MSDLVNTLTWLGLVALGLLTVAGAVVGLLSWFLNHPVDEDVHQDLRCW